MFEPPAALPSSQRDIRFVACCVLALGLHGLILALDLKAEPLESNQQTSTNDPTLDWIEIEPDFTDELGALPAPSAHREHDTDNGRLPRAGADVEATALLGGEAQTAEQTLETGPQAGPESGGVDAPDSGSTATPKRLSLAQLGIGTGPRFDFAPSHRPSPPPTAKQPSAEERLQKSIAQSAAHESQKLGLGITGEVKGALLRATQSAGMNAPGSALFVFTFGEGGVLQNATHNTLGGAGADWARVSSLVKSSLQKKPAQLPAGTKGARLSYAVDYSFVLPSGSKGTGLKLSLTQSFDVADIGATKQAVAKVTLQNYQVF